jgi:hypothetical protein
MHNRHIFVNELLQGACQPNATARVNVWDSAILGHALCSRSLLEI